MTLFTIAAWLVGIACGAIIAAGFYAIAIDRPEHHGEAFGVCTPSRCNTLTGAHLDRQQPVVDSQVDEDLQQRAVGIELQQQAAEIERLRSVIRQRNRTIKHLRTELEQQPIAQPVTVGSLDRFANLEIRGQSCE